MRRATLFIALLLGAACRDSAAPTTPGTDLLPLPLSTLSVSVSTSGTSIDGDGYTATVDCCSSQHIDVNGQVLFPFLPLGNHTVQLSGVADNCVVNGANPRTVETLLGLVGGTHFDVTCDSAPPPPDGTRITGAGTIFTADGVVLSFDFDVSSDLTGRATASDSSDVRPNGVDVGTLTVNASDPETRFTAFRTSSSTCSDPSGGVEFDGIGREDTGGLVQFTFVACDNGPEGSGMDLFRAMIPSEGYDKRGPVTRGDIVKS